jgi:hypothetical protein
MVLVSARVLRSVWAQLDGRGSNQGGRRSSALGLRASVEGTPSWWLMRVCDL